MYTMLFIVRVRNEVVIQRVNSAIASSCLVSHSSDPSTSCEYTLMRLQEYKNSAVADAVFAV